MMIICACLSTETKQSPTCVIDEAVSRPDLIAYRSQLLDALDSRRLDRLKPLIRNDVRVGTESTGWTGFVKQNDFTDSRADDWADMATLLRHGGRFTTPDEFCAPFYACPPDYGGPTADWTRVVILSKGLWAMVEPKASGTRVRQVSCEVLPVGGDGLGESPPWTSDWLSVWLPERRWAYLPRDSVVFINSYLLIDRRQGKWGLAATMGIGGLPRP
jgi:hypothetical protein